jgi:hypothetical protein
LDLGPGESKGAFFLLNSPFFAYYPFVNNIDPLYRKDRGARTPKFPVFAKNQRKMLAIIS